MNEAERLISRRGSCLAGQMAEPRLLSARRLVTGAAMLFIIAALGGAGAAAVADISVRASLDRSRMRLGERAVFTIEVDGVQDATPPALGDLEGLTAEYLGPATQVSIVQGRVSQSVRYRYALLGNKTGRFTVGPVTVSVGGQTYRTEPLALEVTGAPPGGPRGMRAPGKGEPDLGLVLEVEQQTSYVRERIPITLTLYVGATQVDDVQQPQIEGDAFSVEPFGEPVQGRVRIEGRQYRTVRFDTTVVPLRAGALTIGPAVQPMSIVVSRHRRDPFFDRFFGADLFAERRAYNLQSNTVTLTARPLPKEGRPPGFTGAVGQFTLQVSAQPTELRANDPVTLSVKITGSGDLSGVSAPLIDGHGFKTYPAQSQKSEERIGMRVFEQVLIPSSGNVREIPQVQFPYFDPVAGSYRVATAGPIPLVVRPPERTTTAPSVTQGADTSAGIGNRRETLGEDIVYIKDRPGRIDSGAPLYRNVGFLAAQALPLGFYLLALVVARRRERLHGDPRYARFTQAGREARRAIAVARRRAADGQAAEVYDAVTRALREYLSAKLDVPVGAVDTEVVASRLGNADTPVVQRVEKFFALVERVRYAPNATSDGDGRAVVELAEGIVRDLERHRRLGTRFSAGGWLGVLVIMGCLWTAAAAVATDGAERDPVTRFFEANALYKAGNYSAAAARYDALRASGFESGALYYNLGNAYFKAGHLGRAILSYERARRLLPRDPDVRANLRFARGRVRGNAASAAVAGPPLWLRLLVPLAFRARTTELAVATSAIYALTMVLLALRLFVPRWRIVLGRGTLAMGLVLALVGSGCAVRIAREELRTMAVVVEEKDVQVRFEPSDDGTVHFTLPEGALVRVLGQREGWAQIARGDDRRGWLAADVLAIL